VRPTPDCLNRSRPTAPKGQQDSAQGFNPGYWVATRSALKVAPERVRARCWFCEFTTPRHLWCPFRAHLLIICYPGLKPWAESRCPFGAGIDEDGLPRRSLRRRDDEDERRGAGNP
jgi:hypothetical protein